LIGMCLRALYACVSLLLQVHALNNLLQRAAFTAADLNAICHELSPHAFTNPHKSIWGVVSEGRRPALIPCVETDRSHMRVWVECGRATTTSM